MVLLQPTYFAPIIQYASIIQANDFCFEVEDNFQKQTYRNRSYIYTANGKHLLNVPIQKTKGIKQKTKEVKIDYKDDWNKLHLKTLTTAYSSSPFFEFYIDDLLPVFNKRHTFLLDLNFLCHSIIMDALQLNTPINKTPSQNKKTHNRPINHLNAMILFLVSTSAIEIIKSINQIQPSNLNNGSNTR